MVCSVSHVAPLQELKTERQKVYMQVRRESPMGAADPYAGTQWLIDDLRATPGIRMRNIATLES